MQLGADLELAWSHPAATAATRKRILRTALNEIVVRKASHFRSGFACIRSALPQSTDVRAD